MNAERGTRNSERAGDPEPGTEGIESPGVSRESHNPRSELHNATTARRIQWWRSIPQLAAIVLLALGINALGLFRFWPADIALAVFLVIGYRYLAIHTVTRHHLRGMKLVRQGQFGQAADAFASSLAFFMRFPPLDSWRSILFLCPDRWGYRELALMNLGYCYSQLGDRKRAVACYQTCLNIHPDNGVARAALTMLQGRPPVGTPREEP